MCYRVNADLTWKKFADHDRKASNCSYEEEETIWTREQKTTCFTFLFLSNVTLFYDPIKRVLMIFIFFLSVYAFDRMSWKPLIVEKNNLRKVLNYNIVFDVLFKSLFNCCSICLEPFVLFWRTFKVSIYYHGFYVKRYMWRNKKIWLFASLLYWR